MKRQKIRRALILISFLMFPVTIYYLSPVLIIAAGLEGTASGSFLVFAFMFIVSLIFGRAFCSWVCPAGGLMESCISVSDKKAKNGKYNRIKFYLWLPWLIAIIMIFISKGGIKNIDFLYQTDHGISIARPEAYIIYFFFVALIVTLSFTSGKRGFCHYVCWMSPFMIIGSKIKNSIKYPSLHLNSYPDKCIKCKKCTKNCPMSLEVDEMVQKRAMNNSECILCGECIDSCKNSAIKYGITRFDN